MAKGHAPEQGSAKLLAASIHSWRLGALDSKGEHPAYLHVGS